MRFDPRTAQYDSAGWPVFNSREDWEDYRQAVDRMSTAEKSRLARDMTNVMIHRVRERIAEANPDLSEREVMIRAAEEIYAEEPQTLHLLQRLRDNSKNQAATGSETAE